MTLDLTAPAAQLARLADGVRDDQLTDPTPCTETDVAGMLAHVIGLSIGFRDGARKVSGPTTSTPPGPMALPEDWRTQLPDATAQLAAAWQDPAAWEGETTVGGETMPAQMTAGFANDELVVHGWDLAVATGQPYEVAEENLQAAWQLVSNFPDDPQARQGLFGPRIPIADDAPLLDRVIAYTGRDPGWTGPSAERSHADT